MSELEGIKRPLGSGHLVPEISGITGLTVHRLVQSFSATGTFPNLSAVGVALGVRECYFTSLRFTALVSSALVSCSWR